MTAARWMSIAGVMVVAGLAISLADGGCLPTKVSSDFCCVDNCDAHGATAPVGCAAPLVCDAAHFRCVDPTMGGECNVPGDCPSVTPFCVDHVCKQCDGAMGCSATGGTGAGGLLLGLGALGLVIRRRRRR